MVEVIPEVEGAVPVVVEVTSEAVEVAVEAVEEDLVVQVMLKSLSQNIISSQNMRHKLLLLTHYLKFKNY